jgi:hypothetical protein
LEKPKDASPSAFLCDHRRPLAPAARLEAGDFVGDGDQFGQQQLRVAALARRIGLEGSR